MGACRSEGVEDVQDGMYRVANKERGAEDRSGCAYGVRPQKKR